MSSTFQISNGDVVVSSASGRPILVSDRIKLTQDLKEFFEVYVQPSGFGAGIEELIGIVQVDPASFVSSAYNNVHQGILKFIALQRSNPLIYRPNEESIYSFNNLRIEPDPSDPTKFYFTVNILTKSNTLVPVNKVITG